MRKQKYLQTVLVCFLVAVMLTGCKPKDITASEWVIKQYDTLDMIGLFCEDLDQVVTLYVSGAITLEDYMTEMEGIDEELTIMEKQRVIEDIRTGSYSYETKLAKDAYDGVWSDLRSLVDSLKSDETLISDANQMTYFYMAYSESIQEKLDDYTTGYEYVVNNMEG